MNKMDWNLDRSEVLRYMGYQGEADAHIVQTAQDAMDRLTAVAQPRCHYVRLPLDAMTLPGEDICRHLAGCDSMYLLCATLGASVDREIRRAERTSMLTALALDAAAGDGIEKVCDRVGVLIGGKMVLCDTLAAVCAGKSLEDRFFDLYAETAGVGR